MRYKSIDFFEGAFVEQQIDALAGCKLALFMLFGDALFAATFQCLFPQLLQLFNFPVRFHDTPLCVIAR